MKTVKEWLNGEFLKWQMSTGERKTMRDFADYLDIKQTTLNNWLNTKIPPSEDNIKILSEKLGPEIREIVTYWNIEESLRRFLEQYNHNQPHRQIHELNDKYIDDTKEVKNKLLKIVEDWLEENGAKRIH